MCGISVFVTENQKDNKESHAALANKTSKALSLLSHRGPDRMRLERVDESVVFGFTRLCVNDLSRAGDQPFYSSKTGVVMVCNGEIYNHVSLAKQIGAELTSNSDCEVLLRLYEFFGDVQKFVQMVDGVFAFVLFDPRNRSIHVARDMIGIRPLYWSMGYSTTGSLAFASEAKALLSYADFDHADQFPPGHCWSIRLGLSNPPIMHPFSNRYVLSPAVNKNITRAQARKGIRALLHSAVRKRLMSDRKIGILVSGGVDSSLVAAIAVREMIEKGATASSIRTYSVGMPGSVDLKYAREVATFLGTDHHEILLSEHNFISAVERTIWHLESDDCTSVRASVGNLLVSEYIAHHSDDKVVFNGDTADELFGSYLGFARAPNPFAFRNANLEMLANIHHFDVKRSDRCISGAGLEARTPFADLALMHFVMSLPPEFKMFGENGKMEKQILREAFSEGGYLPACVLWRRKEAFSDGVSSMKRPWYKVLQDRAFSERQLIQKGENDNPNHQWKQEEGWQHEEWWYKRILHRFFGEKFVGSPYRWVHPFAKDKEDPSARSLNEYSSE